MHTEAEAKDKDCPFFRYCYNEAGVIQDRDGAIYAHEKCRASDCIMWRMEPPEDFDERCERWADLFTIAAPPGSTYPPEPEPLGFCGLAGKPTQ